MYKQIVLAYDGSASGQKALLEMRELSQWDKTRLTLIAVVPTPIDFSSMEMGYAVPADSSTVEENLRKVLAAGVKSLEAMGFVVTGELLKGDVIREVTSHASRISADLIVVGHHHEKNLLRRWWSGSTAKSLVEEAPCNVLIVIDK